MQGQHFCRREAQIFANQTAIWLNKLSAQDHEPTFHLFGHTQSQNHQGLILYYYNMKMH